MAESRKLAQRFSIGVWSEGSFHPMEKQPEEPITEFAAMLAWTKATFGNTPGKYEFIRIVPGALVVEPKASFSVKLTEA